MDGQMKGYVFAILSLLLMPSALIVNYIALRSVDIADLTFYFFGSALLGAIASLVITRKLYKAAHLFRKHWKPVAALGLVNGVTAVVWFFALKLVGPSSLGFLMRFSTVFTIALGVVYLKEKFNKGEIFGSAMMILGALLMTFVGGSIIKGVFLALFLSLVISLEQLFMKNYVKHIEPLVFNALRLAFTFLVISAYAIPTMNLALPPLNIMLLILLGAVLAGVVGFVLYLKALEISELSKLATIQSLSPFVVVIYSLIFLGSVPTGIQLAGGVIIGLGAFFLVLARYRPRIIEKLWPNF